MNDEPTTDALSRASAYLDGELDAAETAAAEADPAVMAEVAHLRALQEAIRDVPAPASHARETAIGAALAEYDRRRHPAPVVRSRPRPSYSRWLAVAAAVVGVAGLGAVLSSRGGDDSDDAAEQLSAVTEFAANDADADADASLSTRSAAGGATAPAAPQPAAEAQSEQAEESFATEAPAAVLAVPEAGPTTGAPATTATAGDASRTSAPFDPATPIPDEPELGRIGRLLLAEWRDGTRETLTGTACDATVTDLVLLSDALLIVDGTPRPVLVAANPDNDATSALDPDTCIVVLDGS